LREWNPPGTIVAFMSNFLQATGSIIDAIRINQMERSSRDGRRFWVKRRRGWSAGVIFFANTFFRAAENPVIVWSNLRDWQQWEIDSFILLHADEGFCAFADGDRGVWAEQLPGVVLEEPAREGRLTDEMLAAAAKELKRAHRLPCGALGGRWSHGDPHLGNFVFDDTTCRARLIDFELAHHPGMSEADRQADDLLVVFQSMMGYPGYVGPTGLQDWLAAVAHFLRFYRDGSGEEKAVFTQLRRRLEPPTGIGRVWWSIRTDYISATERNRRIDVLKQFLAGF